MLQWVQGNVGAFSWCGWSFQCQFLQPWNQFCQRVYNKIPRTHGSSLWYTAHMAAFMSKKGLMEHAIHHATCQKASMASEDLDTIRPGLSWWWSTTTYLSSPSSCVHIFSKTKATISVQVAGAAGSVGSMVVRRNEVDMSIVQVDVFDVDTWLATFGLCETNSKAACCCWLRSFTMPHVQATTPLLLYTIMLLLYNDKVYWLQERLQ